MGGGGALQTVQRVKEDFTAGGQEVKEDHGCSNSLWPFPLPLDKTRATNSTMILYLLSVSSEVISFFSIALYRKGRGGGGIQLGQLLQNQYCMHAATGCYMAIVS